MMIAAVDLLQPPAQAVAPASAVMKLEVRMSAMPEPVMGTAVMLVALWLFWRSHADLGRNWSVTLWVRKGHEVVEPGDYRRIRHPMYASIWLFDIAQVLLLSNWLAGWSALVSLAPLYFVRVPREEQMMCEFFGQRYRDYMNRTGRLVPRWK